jgi:hypothetical protein
MSALPGETTVADDGQEPGARVALSIAVEVADRPEHGILNGVLRVVLVPKQIAGKRVGVVQVRNDNSLETFDVSLRH